jgi:hypothetical protein
VTLLAATVTKGGVFQVSDRLVSKGGQPFDPTANKNLISIGPTLVASLSYTGIAYVNDLPTDEWIAETLLRRPLPRADYGSAPIVPPRQSFPVPHNSMPSWIEQGGMISHYGRQRTFLNLGAAMFHLMGEIDSVFDSGRVPSLAAVHGLEIQVAGWEGGRRKLSRPVLFRIVKRIGSACRRLARAPRAVSDSLYFDMAPDVNVRPGDKRHFLDRLRQGEAPDTALVEVVRSIAARHATIIGSELMTVFLPPPQSREIAVRFTPATVQTITMYGRPTEFSYTPFVLTPGGFAFPALIVGTSFMRFGPWRLRLQAPAPSGALIGAMYPQRRKRL